jgi:N-formylglutamate deformylase
MLPFKVNLTKPNQLPILISVPHCGMKFPDELKNEFDPSLISSPDDTDWFVDQLYDFAPAIGITVITAVYSRWVIDLNRDPESKPLYTDGRIITGLCPTTTFLGEPLYKDKRQKVDDGEVKRRLDAYYYPYHDKLQQLLSEIKAKFGKVLLWDCHSIRQVVSTIQKEKFPDLILGDADETSASKNLIDVALTNLKSGKYSLQHNHPFKGGHITRFYGNPSQHQHALQLEMTKVNYMDDTETKFDPARAEQMAKLLKKTLVSLAKALV